MATFFWLTVVGGFIKFLYAAKEDSVEVLDVIALVYSVILFIVMLVMYLVTGEDPLANL